MRNSKLFLVVIFSFLLAACVATPQNPISFSRESLPESSRIGIVVGTLPKVQMSYPGAGCLLCLATAAATNSTLSSHVQSYSADDFVQVKSDLKKNLEQQGHVVTLIDSPVDINKLPKSKSKVLNAAPKDFSSYKKDNQIDYLVVVDLNFVGVQRNYASYIPTAAPQAVVKGATYMIGLERNNYVWYKPLSVYRSAEGEWDEPPSFPGVTNAFYQVLENARDAVNEPFTPPHLLSAVK